MVGSPEWIKEKFHVEGEIQKRKENEVCKELFCCAYREYDENSGATGGPGGVLHMQMKQVGGRIRNVDVFYLFKPQGRTTPEDVWQAMSHLNGAVKAIIAAAGYIYSNEQIRRSISKGRAPMLFCHDLGSAYGAYLLGLPYVIVYHQQGSILQEIKSCGGEYTVEDETMIRFVEREVMCAAQQVYFPSIGAREVFANTTLLEIDEYERMRFGAVPLYNTITDVEEVKKIDIYQKLGIEVLKDEEVFVSICDYNYDKGVDRIPQFLKAYIEKTRKKIVWIAIGNATNRMIYDEIKMECETQQIKAYLIPERIKHHEVISLLDYADYYIMLHRKSIFDLATLEAMRAGCKIILSDCQSNREFNVQNNIALISEPNKEEGIEAVCTKKTDEWINSNQNAFLENFSNECFGKRYLSVMTDFLQGRGNVSVKHKSELNKRALAGWKDKYRGKKCVICGSGISLEHLQNREEDTMYFALNRALFYEKIKFDFLFMQDEPQNPPHNEMKEYNEYNCTKFYGIITNPRVKVKGLGGENQVFTDVSGDIVRYELSPTFFDYRLDMFETELDGYCLSDAQSVLFSAIQLAVYMGFSHIQLCGVDFGRVNYGNKENASTYVNVVYDNLLAYKRQLEKMKQVKLTFLYTDNQQLHENFVRIELE